MIHNDSFKSFRFGWILSGVATHNLHFELFVIEQLTFMAEPLGSNIIKYVRSQFITTKYPVIKGVIPGSGCTALLTTTIVA